MSNFLDRLFRIKHEQDAPGKIERAYVSETTKFLNQFLDEHPEIVEDQRTGRALLWDRKVDIAAQELAAKEREPDNAYGYSHAEWLRDKKRVNTPIESDGSSADDVRPSA